jgi:cyclophilin family peptidyl-prolyl cis-trans isomerase
VSPYYAPGPEPVRIRPVRPPNPVSWFNQMATACAVGSATAVAAHDKAAPLARELGRQRALPEPQEVLRFDRHPSDAGSAVELTPYGHRQAIRAASVGGVSRAILHTSEGPVELKLYPEDAPKTVENFTKLAGDGYYDGLAFHRVIPDFMIQGGCPRGDGTGGPGYEFEDEFNQHGVVRGALAMANAGPNTNGSQFFIVTAQDASWLDGKHTVFGQVVSGQDVVDRISLVERDTRDRPLEPVLIDSGELG